MLPGSKTALSPGRYRAGVEKVGEGGTIHHEDMMMPFISGPYPGIPEIL